MDLDAPDPTDPPLQSGERDTLVGFIEFSREVLLRKAHGLDAAQLRMRLAPSAMTLGGMLAHLAFVEDWWFGVQLMGADASAPWDRAPWDDDEDWDWHLGDSMEPDELRDLFLAACARSRAILAEHPDLDQLALAERPGRTPPSLRWILVHMIEEYSRHLGHADLLREAIDGQVGD